MTFIHGLKPIWPLLVGYRWQAVGIVFLMFLSGLTEFIGLSMLVPLVGAAIGEVSETGGILGQVTGLIRGAGAGLESAATFMIFAMLAKNILAVVTVRQRMRLSLELRNIWAEQIFDGALRAPLATLSRQRTGELVEAISSETQKAGNAVASLLEAAHRLILSFILAAGMIATAPLLTFAVGAAIGLTLFALYSFRVFRSIEEGRSMLDHSRAIANITAETMAHVRQIKLLDAYGERRATLHRALASFA
ncbi:MAG: hypothetical protein OEV91_02695, partial [Desulfobulbaceae bacterium]|nr:hypothetical protein [Desulfobulbaceae bacterium]